MAVGKPATGLLRLLSTPLAATSFRRLPEMIQTNMDVSLDLNTVGLGFLKGGKNVSANRTGGITSHQL